MMVTWIDCDKNGSIIKENTSFEENEEIAICGRSNLNLQKKKKKSKSVGLCFGLDMLTCINI